MGDFIATINNICIFTGMSLLILSIVVTCLEERRIIEDRKLSLSFTMSSVVVVGAVVVFDFILIGIG